MTLVLNGSAEVTEKQAGVTATHERWTGVNQSTDHQEDDQKNSQDNGLQTSVEMEDRADVNDRLLNSDKERADVNDRLLNSDKERADVNDRLLNSDKERVEITDRLLNSDKERAEVTDRLLNSDKEIQTSDKCAEKENPLSQHPVDGGYAWVVLIAVFFIQFLLIGYTKSLGVIFVEFQSKFGSNASMTSLIVSVTEAVGSLGSFLVMGFLMKVLSPRSIAMIGCAFFTSAVAGNSLFEHLEYLCLTQGVMYGLASCMIYGPSLFVVTQYFVKRRPLAAAIASCGTSFGGMVFPMLIRRLVDEYSFEGGVLLTAGVITHAFVFSSLLTPIQSYDRKSQGDKSVRRSCFDKMKILFRGHKTESENQTSEELSPLNVTGVENIPDDTTQLEQSNNRVKLRPEDLETSSKDTEATLRDTEATMKDLSEMQLTHSLPRGDNTVDQVKESMCTRSDKEIFKNAVKALYNFNDDKLLVESKLNNNESSFESTNQNNNSSSMRSEASQSSETTSTLPVLYNKLEPPTRGEGRSSIDTEEVPEIVYKTRRKMSQISATTSLFVSTSNIHVSPVGVVDRDDEDNTTRRTPDIESHPNILRRVRLRCGQSTLVRSASFWALTVFYFCAMVGNAIPQTYIPALARERGLTDADGAFFLSLLNVLDFPARMFCGIIVNFRLIRPTTACVPPMLVVALVGHLTPLFTSYESFIGMVIAYGLCLGIYFAMQSLIVIDVLGIDNFRSAIGFYYLFMGLGGAVSYPIAGALKDLTGTYSSTYHYLATMNMVAVFQLLVVVPFCKRYDVMRGVLQETDPDK